MAWGPPVKRLLRHGWFESSTWHGAVPRTRWFESITAHAPMVQGIGRRPPEAAAEVRVLLGALAHGPEDRTAAS